VSVAVIADVHGNIWALDAVLEDIYRRGIHDIFNLGDHLWGALAPARTADRMIGTPMTCIRGNQDRQLLHPDSQHCTAFTLSELSPSHLAWLRSHPPTRSIDGILLCHGTPTSDTGYLLEEVTPTGVHLRIPQLDISESIVLCGHTHIPRIVQSRATLIVNPGSVGLPAYSDDTPVPHKMETGSPHARYAILHGDRVEQVAIRYDYTTAARMAARHGRPDWSHALATGLAI
jgi:putative phosphoesterase